jgi:SAM-dependent methyltransferase
LSEKDSLIQLNSSDFYKCKGCNGGASKLEIGKAVILQDIKCKKCLEKICRNCSETNKIDFAIPYQESVNQDYYSDFFQGKRIPWFYQEMNESTRREIEGKHPSIIKDIVGDGKVLDVGTGRGWLVGFLRELGVEAYGIDYSEYAIDNVFEKAKPFVKMANSQSIPYENGTFDMVIARELLEHLTVEEAINTISEMSRVCKSSGLLYFTIWLNFSDSANSNVLCRDSRDPSHVTFMPRGFWTKLISSNFPYLAPNYDIEAKLDWMNKGRVFVYGMRNY